jgi:hypothetical protein
MRDCEFSFAGNSAQWMWAAERSQRTEPELEDRFSHSGRLRGGSSSSIIGGMAAQQSIPNAAKTASRRRHWNWLLLVPLLLLVYPGLYSRSAPELFGFPFFYWYQFAVVIATAVLTGAVYLLTRNRADE